MELQKYLISLQKMDKNVSIKDLIFTKTLFWVQIHDLPLGDMNLSAACAIGSSIGVVQEGGILKMEAVSCVLRSWWIC